MREESQGYGAIDSKSGSDAVGVRRSGGIDRSWFDMSINDESVASHQFVASGTAYTPTWEKAYGPNATKYWMGAFLLIVGSLMLTTMGPTFGLRLPVHGSVIPIGFMGGLLILGVVIGANLWRHSRHKYLIVVEGGGITIDGQRDTVYSFADAQLSLWANMGVALHLHAGSHEFRLGGRDRRITPTTPLDAPPVQLVDAWLSESDFDRLLALSGRWSGSVAHGPAAGEATRCLLYPNALQMQKLGSFAFAKKQRLQQSFGQPQLFVDVDDDTIRVVDSNSNALIASASIPQVTASPATYKLGGHMFPSAEHLASDAMGQYFSETAAMSLCVPGIQPLTIGCRNFSGLQRRFSWSGNVRVVSDPPDYEIAPADWVTLVEKLGLTSYLEDTADEGGPELM
jgi:hypothetical protein